MVPPRRGLRLAGGLGEPSESHLSWRTLPLRKPLGGQDKASVRDEFRLEEKESKVPLESALHRCEECLR